jgi:vacuolar-type H+-ATPase subunit H
MELIKKIKQAEAQAREIIEKAKADAAENTEQGRKKRLETLAEAERERKGAIDAAVAKARKEGLAEAQNLKNQAEDERRQLRDKAAGRIPDAAAKVMGYLRG